MKGSKTKGKLRTPAKDAISREAAEAAVVRFAEIFETPNGKRWMTLLGAVFDRKSEEAKRRDTEMATATDLADGTAQLLAVLGEMLAVRRLSTAQLFELGSSEEAMQLCTEALARPVREPAGDGHVLRFPRFIWIGDPLPAEAPPEEEKDETFAKAEKAE
jgi:hypothetical protein